MVKIFKESLEVVTRSVKIGFLCLAAAVLMSCHKTPAGFWENFDKDDLKICKSDQGPWGGYRSMYWQKSGDRFSEKKILGYAAENGWKLIETRQVDTNVTQKWAANNQPVFPLDTAGLNTSDTIRSGYAQFPRWIKTPLRLYKFDSGWTTVTEDKTRTAYGYVLLSNDGKQMSVYHLWGE